MNGRFVFYLLLDNFLLMRISVHCFLTTTQSDDFDCVYSNKNQFIININVFEKHKYYYMFINA